MAESDDEERSSDDLSEEISQYRLEDYRKKGIVSQSKELTGLAALLAASATLYMSSSFMGSQILEYMKEVFAVQEIVKLNFSQDGVLGPYFFKALKVIGLSSLPVLMVAMVFGVAGSYAQIGSIFSTEPLTPDLNKLNPIQGFKKLFAPKQLVELLRVFLKISAFIAVAYFFVKDEVVNSPIYLMTDFREQMTGFAESGRKVFIGLMFVILVFAIADFAWQRFQYNKKLRTTRQEAKQENKERDGDPQIKARIRAIQRESSRKRMMQAVRTADVIVTNPTHFAVALLYSKDKMAAPKVVAKGKDLIAQQIKKIAAEAGVPMVENVPLARSLYKSVKIGQYVPRSLYQAVAEVLAYVYRLKHQPGGRI